MIFGTLTLGETALHTHNDSYILEGIKAISTSRPFLSSGVMISALTTIFGIGFNDILYVGELAAVGTVAFVSLFLGLKIGQLRLISRDLAGAHATDAVYGTYGHLNRARLAQASEASKSQKENIKKIEKQIDQLLDRIVDASNGSVVAAYEKRIEKLEREKFLAEEKQAQSGKPRHTFEESFEHAMRFLSRPWNIWANSDLALKKTVLRLAFVEPLPYCRNRGLRTPNLSLPFKTLGNIFGEKCEMVHLTGEESNLLFSVLEDWGHHLAQLDLDGREREDEASNK